MHTASTFTARTGADVAPFVPLVQSLARRMRSRLPASVELDDLTQAGLLGLADALGRFDAGQGIQFEAYATPRIRGAMLDELRGADWVSRGDRKLQRGIATAQHQLTHKLGRAPTEGETANELRMSLAEFQRLRGKLATAQFVRIDDMDGETAGAFVDRHAADHAADPADSLAEHRKRLAVAEAIKALPEREQLVLSLLIDEGMQSQEVAAVLGVTPSRVSQVYRQAVDKLRCVLVPASAMTGGTP
ncbi:MAG: RNA polymerase sigma factor FliA [Burkholderiales bacterium]|nr:RNA polymerase sigma factor FliA [Burkholderiales bacterium]